MFAYALTNQNNPSMSSCISLYLGADHVDNPLLSDDHEEIAAGIGGHPPDIGALGEFVVGDGTRGEVEHFESVELAEEDEFVAARQQEAAFDGEIDEIYRLAEHVVVFSVDLGNETGDSEINLGIESTLNKQTVPSLLPTIMHFFCGWQMAKEMYFLLK